jgi:hypothetical protein
VSQPPQPQEKKVSDLILEEIKSLKSRLDSLTTSQKPEIPIPTAAPSAVSSDDTQQRTHKTLKEMLDCPDCFPDVRAQVIQRHRDNTKEEKLECVGCGSGVKKEWENCPICGNSKAKRRD